MPDFTVSLSEDELATLLALGKVRGVDANTVVKQAIGTEKLIAENVGQKDELLVRRGDSNTFAKFEFGRRASLHDPGGGGNDMDNGDKDRVEPAGGSGDAPAEEQPGGGEEQPGTGSPPDDPTGQAGPAAPSLIGLTLGGANPTAGAVARAAAVAAAVPGTETLVGLGANVTLDGTRREIAFRLIAILGIVIGAYLFISLIFSLSCWTSNSCTVQESYNMSAASFTTVFTALIGIVGSVVGFYFGSKTQ